MGITHLSGLSVAGVPSMGGGGNPAFTGNWWYVDPANGSDGNEGNAQFPFATLYMAYAKCRDGMNDVVALVGSSTAASASAGTARLSTVLAQSVDSTATGGRLNWAKNSTHLIGVGPPTLNSRCRIATPTATYTAATFGTTGNMVLVSGVGCYFANFTIYGGFSSTGNASQVMWTDTGSRNFYSGVSFLGLNDSTSAGGTASRSVSISGSGGEHTFVNCVFGGDTTVRAAANFSLEFIGGSPRNRLYNCIFPTVGSSAGASAITIGADGIDRWLLIQDCSFINATLGGPASTTITDVISNNAATGGVVVVKNSTSIGYTGWAVTAANVVIDGAAPTAATSGLAVAVSA
jgi:hypothetical protein